ATWTCSSASASAPSSAPSSATARPRRRRCCNSCGTPRAAASSTTPPVDAVDLDGVLRRALDERRAAHLLRTRKALGSPQGARVILDGREVLAFSSNDYLGLAAHPRLVAAFKEAADRHGVGSGASHLICGHSRAHHALEEELAAFCGRPRALVFSSGYMANLGIVSALVGKGDGGVGDRRNHASLPAGGLLRATRC